MRPGPLYSDTPGLFGDLDLADRVHDDHDAGAHEPPPCRYAAQRARSCSGTLRRVDYPDGETWYLCHGHEEGARTKGFLSRATVTNWLPPQACRRCTYAPVSLGRALP